MKPNFKTETPPICLQLFGEAPARTGETASGLQSGASFDSAGGGSLTAPCPAAPAAEANGNAAGVPYRQTQAAPTGSTGESDTPADAALQAAAAQDPPPPDRNAAFERLIKGDYKDLYNARVQETVQRRLKGTKETVEKFNALAPTLELLCHKYGVDAGDIAALNRAIARDDTYYEEDARQRGMTVQQFKELRRTEQENALLKQQIAQQTAKQNADRLYNQWLQQAGEVQAVYPGFDLTAELENDRFCQLLRNRVDLRTAYEVVHKDEIIPAAMAYTARTVQQQAVNAILANGARPAENGMSGAAPATVRSDVAHLTRQERQEYARRAAGGERITFK